MRSLLWDSWVSGMETVLAALTFVRRHQQVQSLLGQVGPHQRDLLPQLSITLVLLHTTCSQGGEGGGETCPGSTSHCLQPLFPSPGPAQPFPAPGIPEFPMTGVHELSRTIFASPWGP